MNKFTRTAAGLTALMMTFSLTACGGESEGEETQTYLETMPQVTVEINTETLAEEEQATVDNVADLLKDTELENKKIKWFSFYDPFHATTAGNTKALSLELFETKYGGEIEYIPTTWAKRFSDLSTMILGGEGIDFIAGGDLDSFPKGVPNGQFEPIDAYIDFNDELWGSVKNINDQFELGGKHYLIATSAANGSVVFYNKKTIEEYGFEDPADMLEEGTWTWTNFRNMLTEYVDNENECYGLDGWFNETPLMLTCGVAPVELKDGKLTHNLFDERLEAAMDFMYGLNTYGLVLDKNIFGWQVHPEFISEGKELFYIDGLYTIESSPDIWNLTYGSADEIGFVPMPKMDESDVYYLPAGMEAYMLCKGAQNPEGVARFLECVIASNMDEGTIEIAIEKRKNDFGWTDEMIAMRDKITEMTNEHPMYTIHTGCPTDLYDMLDSGETGIRAAFYGHDWPSVRESLVDPVEVMISDFNESLSAVQ